MDKTDCHSRKIVFAMTRKADCRKQKCPRNDDVNLTKEEAEQALAERNKNESIS